MRILVMNCGSSTLKFELFNLDGPAAGGPGGNARSLASGKVDRIGGRGATRFDVRGGGDERRDDAHTADHAEATRRAVEWLRDTGLLTSGRPDAVGHRVVHGGDRFSAPALVNDDVIGAIEAAAEMAPLHNAGALAAIRATRDLFDGGGGGGQAVPMVAVFDTAFHQTLPEHAWRYAIPTELADRHRVRKYGFHGTAHRYMSRRCAELMGVPVERTKLITLQLGNGCSAAAVEGGRCIDTSMGFSPLQGLVMGTRSGDIDPAAVSYLCRREGVDVAEVEGWLNRRSGLLGLSGASQDMRELLDLSARGDRRAALAVEMFCYRARHYVGAYLAALGGADAVVFGGGIGENAPAVRAGICQRMGWCGLSLDPARNEAAVGTEREIGAGGAAVRAYVIPVDEESIIARETAAVLFEPPGTGV